jgi:hypothetical protein
MAPAATQISMPRYYLSQYLGIGIATTAVVLMFVAYGKGWMNDTVLMLLVLALMLVALFFHELRPFNVSRKCSLVTTAMVYIRMFMQCSYPSS